MLHLYCDVCHGQVELKEGGTSAVCQNCGRTIVVPRGYSRLESQFLFAAQARARQDFEASRETYNEILAGDPDNSGALWGSALARYGVEYQKTGEDYRLICHSAGLKSFEDDKDVQKAIVCASPEEAAVYRQTARTVAELQRRILELKRTGRHYDAYVDCRSGNDAGFRAAQRVAQMLESSGYQTLLPARDLAGMDRQQWEPYLYLAVNTASMAVIAADGKESFDDELTFTAGRFLSQSSAPLALAFSRLDEYADIPERLFDGASVRLNMDDLNFADNLMAFAAGEEAGYSDSAWTDTSATENYAYSNLLKSARLKLESGDFPGAIEEFEQILNYEAEEGQAYWGLLLAELECRNEEEAVARGIRLHDQTNYRNALAFATEREAQLWEQVARDSEKAAQAFAQQEEERIRAEQEAEKIRVRQQEEARQEAVRQQKEREKMKRRRKAAIWIILILAAAGLIGGGVSYFLYQEATKEQRETYQKAMAEYNNRNYGSAAYYFDSLGDYKDSINMYYNSTFREAMSSSRADGIQSLRKITEEYSDAQALLEDWKQEALDDYARGDYVQAMVNMVGFGSETPELGDLYRYLTFNVSHLFDCYGENMEEFVVMAAGEDGTLSTFGDAGDFPEGSYGAVACNSWMHGAVRSDGTVVLLDTEKSRKRAPLPGEPPLEYAPDVSDWMNCRYIEIFGQFDIMALTEDGRILSNREIHVAAEGVAQAKWSPYGLFVQYEDGSVACWGENLPEEVMQEAAGWTNVAYGEVGNGCVAAVTHDNKLLGAGFAGGSFTPKEDVAYFRFSSSGDSVYTDTLDSLRDRQYIRHIGTIDEIAVSYDGSLKYNGNVSGRTELVDFVKSCNRLACDERR